MAKSNLEFSSPSEKLTVLVNIAFLMTLCGPNNTLAIFQNTSYSIFEAVSVWEYQSYGSIRLLRYEVPRASILANWTFYADKSSASCPAQLLQIRLQHAGFPVINPLNETFPADFLLDGSTLYNISVLASGQMFSHTVHNPPAGNWFAAVFGTGKTNVVKKLTYQACIYTVSSNLTVVDRESVEDLLVGQDPFTMKVSITEQESIFRFFLGKETWSYDLTIRDCQVNGTKLEQCPLAVYTRSGALPTNQSDSEYVDCSTVQDKACQMEVLGPKTNQFQYIMFYKLKGPGNALTFHMTVNINDCSILMREPYCYPLHKMYRISEVGNDFRVTFALKPTQLEYVENGIFVPDLFTRVFQFDVIPMQDSGGTLRFRAMFNDTHVMNNTNYFVNVTVCVARDSIPVSGTDIRCDHGVSMSLSSVSNQTGRVIQYFPYPRSGSWYIAMQSYCYTIADQAGEAVHKTCQTYDIGVKFDLQVAPCMEGACGIAGHCSQYTKGVLTFSACQCRAGYRGYGCTDDSEAESAGIQLMYTLLLTLSNLFFLPSVCISIYKKYYTEALVYFSNMFFSTFYHACDSAGMSLYTTCIMPYHVMSYCDFFLSIMSIWVTLVAMAELQPALYSLAHMLGVVVLSVGLEWQQHGIWPYIIPICAGVFMVLISWLVRSRQQRRFYPGLRRCAIMLPGALLAGAGMCIFGFFETDQNYAYLHSIWHVSMAVSIVFFLPPRKQVEVCYSDSVDTSSNESVMEELNSPVESVSLMVAGGQVNMAATMMAADKDDVVLLD